MPIFEFKELLLLKIVLLFLRQKVKILKKQTLNLSNPGKKRSVKLGIKLRNWTTEVKDCSFEKDKMPLFRNCTTFWPGT